MSQGGEVKTEEMGKARILGQSLGRAVVVLKHNTNVLFVTIQVTSRRIVREISAPMFQSTPFSDKCDKSTQSPRPSPFQVPNLSKLVIQHSHNFPLHL